MASDVAVVEIATGPIARRTFRRIVGFSRVGHVTVTWQHPCFLRSLVLGRGFRERQGASRRFVARDTGG